ncbi:MAG: hypothetical protein WAT09_08725 [Paracoccaceae bacterium]
MSRSTKDTRPKIWAEGAQNPPLHPRAFALASVIFARDSLSGLLTRCATSATGFGQTVATGRWRVPPHRLGRTGRYLPTVAQTAGSISGLADVLQRASLVVQPAKTKTGTPAAPHTAMPDPTARVLPRRPVAAPRVQAAPHFTGEEDPDLALIRQLLADAPAQPQPALQSHHAASADLRPAPPAAECPDRHGTSDPGWRRDLLQQTAAQGLGYGLLALSLPVGAARALLAHLNGEDLREMVAPPTDLP